MSKIHHLKTLPAYYDAVERGEKTFEIRRDDRGFQRGDVVRLKRFDPQLGYTSAPGGGRFSEMSLDRRILWILTGGQFGVEPGYVILALGTLDDAEPDPAVWAWREADRDAISTALNELRIATEVVYSLARHACVDKGDFAGTAIRNALGRVHKAIGTLGEVHAPSSPSTGDRT